MNEWGECRFTDKKLATVLTKVVDEKTPNAYLRAFCWYLMDAEMEDYLVGPKDHSKKYPSLKKKKRVQKRCLKCGGKRACNELRICKVCTVK